MATFTANITQYQTSLAMYQAANQAISNIFSQSGWVKSSDTGQSVGAAVPVAGAVNGYEIWKMNDALQATTPCFAKVEYGTSSDSVGRMCFYLTIGSGSDGAGNLTGQIGTRARIQPWTQDGSVTTCLWSGTTSRIAAWMNRGLNSPMPHAWGIERTHNPTTGADTGDGILTTYLSYGETPRIRVQFIPQTGVIRPQHGAVVFINNVNTVWYGGKGYLQPLGVMDSKGLKWFSSNFLIHPIFDVAPSLTYTVQITGQTRTYLSGVIQNNSSAFQISTYVSDLVQGTPSLTAFSMLWE